jgi:hypothetical protein
VVKALYESETARSQAEAEAAFARLAAAWGLPLLAQRFVAGEEYDVAALGDGRRRRPGAVAMRKTIVTGRQGLGRDDRGRSASLDVTPALGRPPPLARPLRGGSCASVAVSSTSSR